MNSQRNTTRQTLTTTINGANINDISTIMLTSAVKFVKRNPVPSSLYFFGLLACLFFNGFQVSSQNKEMFEKTLNKIDYDSLYALEVQHYNAKKKYHQSMGWFYSCNDVCQDYKRDYLNIEKVYKIEQRKETEIMADAKSNLGLFSTYGISETRDLFWKKFAQGRGFAQRQSTWDALFLGIGAMSRDETLMEYFIKVLMNLLINFTFGMIMAVVIFIFSLYNVIVSYKASIIIWLPYFFMVSIAAISFVLTWLIGLYLSVAGTVYVGAKVLATNVRLEDGDRYRHQYGGRVRRE